PEELLRMRHLAMTVLFAGAFGSLLVAIVPGLSLLWKPDEVAPLVLPITVGAPILIALLIPVVVLLLRAKGFVRCGPLFTMFLAGNAVVAAVVNYLILAKLEFDPYVFGFFMLFAIPLLTSGALLAGFISVWFYRHVGLLLQKVAIFLFVGFVVV